MTNQIDLSKYAKLCRRYRIPLSRRRKYTQLLQIALGELPIAREPRNSTKNGEGLFHDEAEIQKRIISFRLAKLIQPPTIIETHPGSGFGSRLYRAAAPSSAIKRSSASSTSDWKGALVDIDPFGRPWDTLNKHRDLFKYASVVQVTSGEVYSVVRNWPRTFQFPTKNIGKKAPRWVVKEFLPRIEDAVKMKCHFFYAFPTSVRLVMARRRISPLVWDSCDRWLSWFSKYGSDYG